MDKISTILKKRIKDMGYTQENFAEECGISAATLKSYIKKNSKTNYNIEMLKIFSQKLDCSYDYLLGKSDTPYPEIQSLKDEICLSRKKSKRFPKTTTIGSYTTIWCYKKR